MLIFYDQMVVNDEEPTGCIGENVDKPLYVQRIRGDPSARNGHVAEDIWRHGHGTDICAPTRYRANQRR